MAGNVNCIACTRTVGARQEAIQCGVCQRLQHRKCGPVMDRGTYLDLVRSGQFFSWNCHLCFDKHQNDIQMLDGSADSDNQVPEKETEELANESMADSNNQVPEHETEELVFESTTDGNNQVPEHVTEELVFESTRDGDNQVTEHETEELVVESTADGDNQVPEHETEELAIESTADGDNQVPEHVTEELANESTAEGDYQVPENKTEELANESTADGNNQVPEHVTEELVFESTTDGDNQVPEHVTEELANESTADGDNKVPEHETEEFAKSTGNLNVEGQPESPLSHDGAEEVPITYTMMQAGSKKGKGKVFDSLGFSYVFKKTYADGNVLWRCPLRNKDVRYCPATVKQCGDVFERGGHNHVHEAPQGAEAIARIFRDLKRNAVDRPREKTSFLVREVLRKNLPNENPQNCPDLPSMERLCHAVRSHRRKNRLAEPKDISFDLRMDYIPDDFLVDDVWKGDEGRCLIFATKAQLQLLANAKCWYADATSKVSCKPFMQLFSIHAFVKSGECPKQVPLCYVFMTRRRKRDYRSMFRALRRSLPADPKVRRVVMDFEPAMWRGCRSVFPKVSVRGCTFHWRQSVWRKVRELGLCTAYTTESSVQSYIRKLMALPMLPADTIRPQFQILRTEATTEALKELCSYIEETWMDNDLWAPDAWCIFKSSIRTSNDVEGWHQELNQTVGMKPSFYSLVKALHNNASFVPAQVLLVSEGKLQLMQKRAHRTIQARLHQYWEEFENGERSVYRLLRASSRLFGKMDQ